MRSAVTKERGNPYEMRFVDMGRVGGALLLLLRLSKTRTATQTDAPMQMFLPKIRKGVRPLVLNLNNGGASDFRLRRYVIFRQIQS